MHHHTPDNVYSAEAEQGQQALLLQLHCKLTELYEDRSVGYHDSR